MDNREAVKKILERARYRWPDGSPQEDEDELAKELQQLFPKTEDNPNGHDCATCFYKSRYSPPPMYDSDFGRTTGSKRP